MLKISARLMVVPGACYSAIYNFNNNCIYRLSQQALSQIHIILDRINSGLNLSGSFSEAEINFLEFLQQEQIVIDASIQETPLIAPTPTIDFAWVELTQKCNLKCVHCYEKDKNFSDIPLQSFYYIVDALVQLGVRRIQLTGGEPLLYSNLIPALTYCEKKFDFIELYTNGTLLIPEVVEYCKNQKIRIAISSLASSKEGYEEITQVPNSFSLYSAGLHLLETSGVQFRLGKITVNKHSGLDNSDGSCDFPRLVGYSTLDLYSPEMLRQKIITPRSFAKKFIPELVLLSSQYNRCFCSSIYIDVEGYIYPCPMERRIVHGNIFCDALDGILKPHIAKMNKDCIAECSHCEYRYACIDCRPDANGRGVLEKPWYCSYDPLHGVWMDEDAFIASLLEKGG